MDLSRYFRMTFSGQDLPDSLEILCPDNFNFAYDVADVLAEESPTKTAMVWCNDRGEERSFTFQDIRCQSNRAANVFRTAGIRPGDRVMVILKRHYEYWFVALALHKLGAVLVPMTHMLTVSDLVYRMESAQVKGVVCTRQDGVPDRVRDAAVQCAASCPMWTVQGAQPGFTDLTQAMADASPQFPRQPTRKEDPMLLYFTSGTTGAPKGVLHDHTYPLAHYVTAKYWHRAQAGGLHFSVAETGWAKASWGKLYGQWLVGCGVMVYDFDAFDPKRLVDVINRYQVTSFCAPPTVYRYLVKKGLPPMPSLRQATTAGEQLAPDVFRQFRAQTGLPLREGFGQTETTLLLANFGPPVEGSMGRSSPLYHIALLLPDGTPAKVGEIGEIVLVLPETGRQPGLLSHYLEDPDGKGHLEGSHYHTGDAAWRDAHGNYWFHGRFDDIIKTGGFRVGPWEVEHVLQDHPAVLECAVVGIPDPLRGQAIKAVVVPAPGQTPSRNLETELKHFVNRQLAEYKWVRKIEFAPELPKTISGKVRKTALRT